METAKNGGNSGKNGSEFKENPEFELYGRDFQQNFKLLRKSFGYSATDIAIDLNLATKNITNMESRNTYITPELFDLLNSKMSLDKAELHRNTLAQDVWRYYIMKITPPIEKSGLFLTTLAAFIEKFYVTKDEDGKFQLIWTWEVLKNVMIRENDV